MWVELSSSFPLLDSRVVLTSEVGHDNGDDVWKLRNRVDVVRFPHFCQPRLRFASAYEEDRVNHVSLGVIRTQLNCLRQLVLCLAKIPFIKEGQLSKPGMCLAQRRI